MAIVKITYRRISIVNFSETCSTHKGISINKSIKHTRYPSAPSTGSQPTSTMNLDINLTLKLRGAVVGSKNNK